MLTGILVGVLLAMLLGMFLSANPFLDFVASTRERRIPSGPAIVNNATAARQMLIVDMFQGGTPARQPIQGGEYIFDLVRLDKFSTGTCYLPYDLVTSTEPSVLSKIKCPWRMFNAPFSYSDAQLTLNDSEDAWVKLLQNWRAAVDQGLCEALEAFLFASIDAEMETKETMEGTIPYSIQAFVTTDGLAPAGFTTVMGVNPAAGQKEYWQNQHNTYTAASFEATWPKAMRAMRKKLLWKVTKKQWSQSTSWQKCHIYTDDNGEEYAQEYLNARNNRLYSKLDDYDTGGGGARGEPAEQLAWYNIPIEALDGMTGWGNTNPYYYWLDWNWLCYVVHSTMYLAEQPPVRDSNRVGVFRIDNLTWFNLFCQMRNRLGLTYPA